MVPHHFTIASLNGTLKGGVDAAGQGGVDVNQASFYGINY